MCDDPLFITWYEEYMTYSLSFITLDEAEQFKRQVTTKLKALQSEKEGAKADIVGIVNVIHSLPTPKRTTIVCLTAFDNYVLAGTGDGSILVWDRKELKQVNEIPPPAGETKIYSLLVVNNEIWGSYETGSIAVWDKNFALISCVNEHKDLVRSITLVDNTVWSGDINGKVFVWNLAV